MDDLISRRAAIDALRAMQTYKLFAGDDMLLIDQAGAQTELMLLPPAQPEQLGTDLAEVGTDMISRQAAIDAIGEVHPLDYNAQAIKSRIEQLPSAQPEIIRCKDCKYWTKQEDSLQGRCALFGIYPTGRWYCANADVRGEKENENNIQ